MKIALKSTDPIEARRVKQKGYSQLTGAILDSIFCLFFFLLAINCCLHVKITSLWTLFACLNVFVEADRIRRIGIDPVCSESCLTVPPTLGEASGVSAAVLPSAVAPCSCKNLRPSRGSEEVTRRGLQDIFPVAAAGLCGRQGSKMSLHVHRTQRWAHLKFTAFLGLFPYASAQEQTLDYKILQPILVYLQSIV